MKETDFAIERVVVRVPTNFILFEGERYIWEQFHQSVETLKQVGEEKAISTRSLNADWVREWEDKGVIEHYFDWPEDDYGVRTTKEMIKPGVRYKHFMAAWKAFEKVKEAEMVAAATERRRGKLLAELKDLDKPARRRTFEENYEAATTVG
jgi:hypothetical protein